MGSYILAFFIGCCVGIVMTVTIIANTDGRI